MDEGMKWIHNQTGHDITVTLFIRSGGNPQDLGGTEQTEIPRGASQEVVYVGYPGAEGYVFLNGLLVEWEEGGNYVGVSKRVKQRGDAWDATLNTNNTLTIDSVSAGSLPVSGSNR